MEQASFAAMYYCLEEATSSLTSSLRGKENGMSTSAPYVLPIWRRSVSLAADAYAKLLTAVCPNCKAAPYAFGPAKKEFGRTPMADISLQITVDSATLLSTNRLLLPGKQRNDCKQTTFKPRHQPAPSRLCKLR